MCITCDSSQRKDESHTVTHPFRGVTCDSPVTSENDIESSGKESVEGFIRNETAKRNTEQNRTFAEHVRSEHPVEPNEPNTLSIESVRCSVCVRSENDLPDKKAPVVLEEIPKEVSLPRVEPEPGASVPVKPSGKKTRKREEAELERLFKDAEPDECSPSRGIPIDAVPADVVLPCLVFDGKKDRWLVRVDVLGNGRRLFHTAWSEKGRVTWSFEEPVKAAAS